MVGEKNINELLIEVATDNTIACSKVFEIVNRHSFFPDLVGIALNNNKIKITFCQLGLFGYTDGKIIPVSDTVSESLKDMIYSNLEDGKLPCPAAWNIAAKIKKSKLDVSTACEKLGIKINKCQLGAF